jgi:hypothetical protein
LITILYNTWFRALFLILARGPRCYSRVMKSSALARHDRLRKRVVTAVIVIMVVLIGAVGYLAHRQANSPSQVFQKSLALALSTSSVSQKQVTKLSNYTPKSNTVTFTIQYDVANVGSPSVAAVETSHVLNDTFNVKTYADSSNSYGGVFVQTGKSSDPIVPTLNKWVQIRKDGTYDPNYVATKDTVSTGSLPSVAFGATLTDDRLFLLGQYIFGNFSASDRSNLLNFINANDIFKYNPKTVTTTTLNGQKVYVYHVTFNTAALSRYNEKVAKLFNISPADLQTFLRQLNLAIDKTNTLYIAVHSHQLVQVQTNVGLEKITDSYSNYNDVTMPAVPKPGIPFAQFAADVNSVCENADTYHNTTSLGADTCIDLAFL